MLNFVIGTAGTGKSKYIQGEILKLARRGEKCLFLVPEQFSQTGEALLFSSLENARLNMVQLFSFTSLLRDAMTNYAAVHGDMITEAGKAVLAARAGANVSPMLNLYRRNEGDFSFSFNLTSLFDDFKRSGISPETFYTVSQGAPRANEKLRELSLLYSEYCALLGGQFSDNEDMLTSLAHNLPHNYTYNTHIFIDGFESFSAGQMAVIGRMLTDAADVTVALTCDSLTDYTQGTGNFSFVQNTAAQLMRLARDRGVKISPAKVMKETSRFKNPDLVAIDNYLQTGDGEKVSGGHRFLNSFAGRTDEVYFAAAVITKLVKQGLSYNDIALVCPQLEKYEGILQDAFAMAQIPYFIDENRIISSSAPVMLFKSLLALMYSGPVADAVLPVLKTGLTFFDDDTISDLENYLYIWQDYTFSLSDPFDLPPGGIKKDIEPREQEYLDRLNRARRQFCDIIQPFTGKGKRPLSDIVKDCWQLALLLGRDDKLRAVIESLGDDEDSDLLTRQWQRAVDCLDRLFTVAGDQSMTCSEAGQLFRLGVEGSAIGFTPETQDCVMITDPKRMRLSAMKAVIILGAARDYFPAQVSENSLISAADRQYLKDNDCPLKNNFENLLAFENLYYYKALTGAEEYMFICYSANVGGEKQQISPAVATLAQSLSLPYYQVDFEDYAITPAFFADFVANRADASSRFSYLELLNNLGIDACPPPARVFSVEDTDLVLQKIGGDMNISPTAAEDWYSCAFMYFLKRIMGIRPLEKVEFSYRLAGDYLHNIVQRIMAKYGPDYYKTPMEEIEGRIDTEIDKFLRENYPEKVYSGATFTAQHENMKKNAAELLRYIHSEQEGGLFRPVAFEQRIGMDGRIPPLKIKAGDGRGVNVRGIVDRIDIYRGNDRDYLRIVDYKTGSQKFNLDDVYNGLSTQLLLYMAALKNSNFGQGEKEITPGAVVYQSADRQTKFDKDDESLYTAVGMALADREISHAFDTTDKGRFGVLSVDKNKVKKARGSETVSDKKFDIILDWAQQKVAEMAGDIYSGNFDSMPLERRSGRLPCEWCAFSAVCANKTRKKEMEKNKFSDMEKEAE